MQDYVVAMWKMLQQRKADDYVISTGKQYTVKNFIYLVAKLDMKISWVEKGHGKCIWNKKVIIKIDKNILDLLKLSSYEEITKGI